MDFREFNYILTLAEYQNMTRAAESLYVSQSTLSKCLFAVEKELDVKLFYRDGNKYYLTNAGEHYTEKARQILRLREKLDAELLGIRKQEKGILRVGLPECQSSGHLQTALRKFRKKFPEVLVEFSEEASENPEKKLLEGELDLIFESAPGKGDSRLEYTPVCVAVHRKEEEPGGYAKEFLRMIRKEEEI